jgi:hypothetical protein
LSKYCCDAQDITVMLKILLPQNASLFLPFLSFNATGNSTPVHMLLAYHDMYNHVTVQKKEPHDRLMSPTKKIKKVREREGPTWKTLHHWQ